MTNLLARASAGRCAAQSQDVTDEQSDIELLHAISVALIGEQNRTQLYGKIVEAAIAIMGAQFGTMQWLCPPDDPSGHGGQLQLLAHRGLPADAVAFWQWVSPKAYSSCNLALRLGQRALVPDFEAWEEIAGTEDLLAFRRAGIRSAQTTPLLSRTGDLLGMISTHWSAPHEPSHRDLRLLDILARQAADLLERTIAEEASRAREQELERSCAALRTSEELQKLLSGELSHRVKNMLATVQAIAVQTLRHCDEPAEFVESFGGRIQSMSRVHSQLSDNDWRGTALADIVRDQMELGPVDEAQITAGGPQVHLDANLVPKVAMILHELGTNSLKYGALSSRTGAVLIEWSVDGPQLKLLWSERGAPKASKPYRRGFGTRLIETSARGGGGGATMSFGADGVHWDIRLPLTPPQAANTTACGLTTATILTEDHPRPDAAAARLTALQGKRILVVEDEPLLAMDMVAHLEAAGVHVVGPACDAAAAMELIEQYRIHAALLDANLVGQPVDEIAQALIDNRIPFAFVTGYGRMSLPSGFEDVALLSKPFSASQLANATVTLIEPVARSRRRAPRSAG